MLAFTTPAEPTFTGIESIIKVNSIKEVVTFNDESNTSPTSTTTRDNSSTNGGTTLIGIQKVTKFSHPPKNHSPPRLAPSSVLVPKTILKNSINNQQSASSHHNPPHHHHPKYRLSDKMFGSEEDHCSLTTNNNTNNGNANYNLADTINSNNATGNNPTMTSSPSNNLRSSGGATGNINFDHHQDLQLISHGLTDSVCETIKLLESEFDKKCDGGPSATSAASLSSGISASSSSTSGGIGGGIDEQPPNVVYTEEIVISTARSNSAAVTGVQKPGIMKTFSSFSPSTNSSKNNGGGSSSGVISRRTAVEQWKSQLNEEGEEEEAMSQSNESEETPLLGASEPHPTIVSSANDNISNNSVGTSGNAAPSSALNKLGKLANGAKATGLKR